MHMVSLYLLILSNKEFYIVSFYQPNYYAHYFAQSLAT